MIITRYGFELTGLGVSFYPLWFPLWFIQDDAGNWYGYPDHNAPPGFTFIALDDPEREE
jgi:hypothetical protein